VSFARQYSGSFGSPWHSSVGKFFKRVGFVQEVGKIVAKLPGLLRKPRPVPHGRSGEVAWPLC
jgi:hypothetical protein